MIVADLLADAALQLRLHTPSSPGRLDRRISWCAPTEIMDPTPLLTPHVLLLTNGIGMNIEDDSDLVRLRRAACRCSRCGYCLRNGNRHHFLPPGLGRGGHLLRRPLLEIPHFVSFLQVHRHITNVLQARTFHRTVPVMGTRGSVLPACCHSISCAEDARRGWKGSRGFGGDNRRRRFVIAQSPGTSHWTDEDLRRAATDGDDERSVPLPMGGATRSGYRSRQYPGRTPGCPAGAGGLHYGGAAHEVPCKRCPTGNPSFNRFSHRPPTGKG